MRSLSLIGLFAPAFVFANSEGVSPKATDLFTIAGYPISNSILTTWIIAGLIILGVRGLENGNHGCQFLGRRSATNHPQRLLKFVLVALGAHMLASH